MTAFVGRAEFVGTVSVVDGASIAFAEASGSFFEVVAQEVKNPAIAANVEIVTNGFIDDLARKIDFRKDW